MAMDELVDGAGWISDDSSFYGDAETAEQWLDATKRQILTPQEHTVSRALRCKITHRSDSVEDSPSNAALAPINTQASISDFLKSRPQVANLQSEHKKSLMPRPMEATRRLDGAKVPDLVDADISRGHPTARQQSESIDDFLRRLPVNDPATANMGPWLWVDSPRITRRSAEQRRKTNVNAFCAKASILLQAFVKHKSVIEAQNEGKAPGTITRKCGPYRDQLKTDLLAAAVETRTTCGKWMLFPDAENLPRTWRLVAEATSQGRLGPTAKVATPDPFDGKDATLICVYTYDFTDKEDVRRVLEELLDLGVFRRDGKPIYYKCDAYTYIGIESNNPYKLQASIYSSKEMLKS